jgi:hypothetical protein
LCIQTKKVGYRGKHICFYFVTRVQRGASIGLHIIMHY